MKPTFYCQPNKAFARTIGEKFANGCGGNFTTDIKQLRDGPAVFYGVTRDTLHLYRQCVNEDREYYYIDNGYFSPGHHDDGYFKVTKNAAQHSGFGNATPERFLMHGLDIKPWRTEGKYILVTVQSDWWYERHFTSKAQWLKEVLHALKVYTDIPVLVREKPRSQPDTYIYDDIRHAWALITHSSNTAVQAVLEGVPIFVTWPCAALAMGTLDLSLINDPLCPRGRYQWACNLADNQWSMKEIENGKCWKDLNAKRMV